MGDPFFSPPYRFLALGNSYTIGTGVPAAESWPRKLISLVRDAGVPMKDPWIIAQNGWTSADLIKTLESTSLPRSFHLVSLQIGVNDQYDGVPVDEYRKHFGILLETSLSFTAGNPTRVIVLSIPDWSVTPFVKARDQVQIRAEIERFNNINRHLTKTMGVRYVDITPLSRRAREANAFLAEDGLHYSGKMYQIWGETVLPVILDRLTK
ncbi:MAG: GDSL-type esterase/lipase family protein [Anaerolineales bacterium]